MFHCYILKSKLNSAYYVGSCKNIKVRLEQHNKFLVPVTKRYASWILVYNKEFESLREARAQELKIKSWKKRSAIEKLFKHKKF